MQRPTRLQGNETLAVGFGRQFPLDWRRWGLPNKLQQDQWWEAMADGDTDTAANKEDGTVASARLGQAQMDFAGAPRLLVPSDRTNKQVPPLGRLERQNRASTEDIMHGCCLLVTIG
jgi:hypothetical protein